MSKVVIFSDSTCDLTEELINENDIKIVPLYVAFETETYKDGLEINTDKLYELVGEKKMLPKTAAASIYDFVSAFKPYIDLGYEIFYTGISSKMSSTMQNAINAAKELDAEDKIFVSDSLNLSSAIGLLVLKACKLKDEGKSAKEIKEEIDIVATKVKAGFVIKTMDFLYKGGRCSALAMIFGTMLKIKPFIRTKDGSMYVHKKPRGKMTSAIDVMINEAIEDINIMDLDHIMITHSHGDMYVSQIEDKLKEAGLKNINITKAGCVISSHCGEGTIGILYITK